MGLGVDASRVNLGLVGDAFRPKVSQSTWGWAWTRPGLTWGLASSRSNLGLARDASRSNVGLAALTMNK